MPASDRQKPIDMVIVWKLDRFSRNRYDSARYKTQLKRNGVKVVSATEVISDGAEGIILESVLEAARDDLEQKIASEKLAKPRISAEFITFWLHRFRKLDVTQKAHRKMLMDTFINAIFLYDDKLEITFNFKEGTRTVTFSELQEVVEKGADGSDMDSVGAPNPFSKMLKRFLYLFRHGDGVHFQDAKRFLCICGAMVVCGRLRGNVRGV